MRVISCLFLLIIVLFGMTFATLNAESVTINYYAGHATLPLSLLLVMVFAAGCLIGLMVGLGLLVKAKIKNYHLHQRVQAAEKQIENLRSS